MLFEYETPEELLAYMSDFNYKEYDGLMNPVDVYIYGEGSCHDQTLFELDMLGLMQLKPMAKFLMAVDKDGVGGETHSFAYWVDDVGVAYWFENAWEDYRGIHRFNDEEELISTVVDHFSDRNPHQYIYMSEFNPEQHTIGEDLETFVDICMEDAIQV